MGLPGVEGGNFREVQREASRSTSSSQISLIQQILRCRINYDGLIPIPQKVCRLHSTTIVEYGI